MFPKAPVFVCTLFLVSCGGMRSVQVRPPIAPPSGLVWGYGVEKLKDNPEHVRQAAYLKAIDDLLSRGPVLVSKTVQDRTTVVGIKPASRTMESTFRLRASQILQPSFIDTGAEDGFLWVLVGTTEADIDKGWRDFVAWRTERIGSAGRLYGQATGSERVTFLRAASALLEEVGAQDDPDLLYYEVKSALEAEVRRIAELDALQQQVRKLIDTGELATAEQCLEQGLRLGLEETRHQQLTMELHDRRGRAKDLIASGDDFFRDEKYKEALERYQQAQLLDRNNPGLPTKLAMADRYHRAARSATIRSTVNAVGWSATHVLSEYFKYKREQEERKRAEAEENDK